MTLLQIKTRFLALIDESTISTTHISHINAFVKDVINAFPFSWNIKKDSSTGVLSSGTFNMPTDFNPIWGIEDARIEGSSTSDDNIFTPKDIKDRDSYTTTDYVYWVTQTPAGTYVFNSKTLTGTVVLHYHFIPTDLSADGDICIVPDGEAVAYGSASKNWIGDERNVGLKDVYEKEAASRIQRMYAQDLNFGPKYLESSKISQNSSLTSPGV